MIACFYIKKDTFGLLMACSFGYYLLHCPLEAPIPPMVNLNFQNKTN